MDCKMKILTSILMFGGGSLIGTLGTLYSINKRNCNTLASLSVYGFNTTPLPNEERLKLAEAIPDYSKYYSPDSIEYQSLHALRHAMYSRPRGIFGRF